MTKGYIKTSSYTISDVDYYLYYGVRNEEITCMWFYDTNLKENKQCSQMSCDMWLSKEISKKK